MEQFIINHRELQVYEVAFDSAMQVFEVTRTFPLEEQDRLTLPLIQSARLVCIHISQAWQRRRYRAAFVARLNQAEAEAAATQVWIEFAVLCSYLNAEQGQELLHDYREVLLRLAHLIRHADAWVLPVNVES
jgi:four helix bundle protein